MSADLLHRRMHAATAGFGVNYTGLHGTDERIEIAGIPVIQAAYHSAVLTLLAST